MQMGRLGAGNDKRGTSQSTLINELCQMRPLNSVRACTVQVCAQSESSFVQAASCGKLRIRPTRPIFIQENSYSRIRGAKGINERRISLRRAI
ncbi:hypothetical protein I7I48_07840 [Histoplasma ohiense]|nr:hypothetical protein I7I48_07840 [Histoplasma ohiense (nom. inval.)]